MEFFISGFTPIKWRSANKPFFDDIVFSDKKGGIQADEMVSRALTH